MLPLLPLPLCTPRAPTEPMLILGLNMFHADASAAIVHDGEVIFAIAEERLHRQKHFGGVPLACGKSLSERRWRENPWSLRSPRLLGSCLPLADGRRRRLWRP